MKNHTYLYLPLVLLILGFGFFSFFLFLTKGKNKYLLGKKLAIGASIIGLTCVANGCKPVVTCYVRAIDPVISSLDSLSSDQHIIISKSNTKLSFNYKTYDYNYQKYSLNDDKSTIFYGDCSIQNDDYNNSKLLVEFPNTIDTGVYKLVIYYFDKPFKDKDKEAVFSKEYNIRVVE
ncbi:MAG: hypothetical protein PHH30_09820 [Bacteroidales bacterium]|nr:hypothetical protein [Bacteroidales bacterium]